MRSAASLTPSVKDSTWHRHSTGQGLHWPRLERRAQPLAALLESLRGRLPARPRAARDLRDHGTRPRRDRRVLDASPRGSPASIRRKWCWRTRCSRVTGTMARRFPTGRCSSWSARSSVRWCRACWRSACASPSSAARRVSDNRRLVLAFGGGVHRRLGRADCQGLHKRAGADRRLHSQCRQPRLHAGGLRRRLWSRVLRAQGMAMTLPLSSSIELSVGVDLTIAFVLGVGFGFALERAGFGSARKLTAVFYLYDMAVVKVMFTAIVTAMVGIFILSAAGVLERRRALRRADEPRRAGDGRARIRCRVHHRRLLPRHVDRRDRHRAQGRDGVRARHARRRARVRRTDARHRRLDQGEHAGRDDAAERHRLSAWAGSCSRSSHSCCSRPGA